MAAVAWLVMAAILAWLARPGRSSRCLAWEGGCVAMVLPVLVEPGQWRWCDDLFARAFVEAGREDGRVVDAAG